MRYGIQFQTHGGPWKSLTARWDDKAKRDAAIAEYRLDHPKGSWWRPIRILSAAEAKRKAQAEKLREVAERLLKDAKENDLVCGAKDYSSGIRWAAQVARDEANRMWPRKRGG